MRKPSRLGILKPLIATMPQRLSVSREDRERKRLREREQNTDYRKWYKLRKWELLREQVLIRDLYTCQQTGVLLVGKHPAPNSPTVDHVRAHGGDPDLFWDINNLQAVSKEWHDSQKQARERAERKAAAAG